MINSEYEWMEPGFLNCGPVALGNAIKKDPRLVRAGWPTSWKNPSSDKKLGVLPIDTPWHHLQWFHSNPEYAVKFHENINDLRAWMKPKRTVVLIHNTRKPWTPLTEQHWCLIHNISGTTITVDMDGSGKFFKSFDKNDFDDWMTKGWPFCAYTVTLTKQTLPQLSLFQRFYLWLLSK